MQHAAVTIASSSRENKVPEDALNIVNMQVVMGFSRMTKFQSHGGKRL